MSKQTYYIVQVFGDKFLKVNDEGYYVPTHERDKAAHLTISEARRLFRDSKTWCSKDDTPRRFPRILKVTEEIKTITPRR